MVETVHRHLPDALHELRELALDLFWTWSHCGDALWSRLGPDVWEQTRNPWIILQTLSHARLEELALDETFREELHALAAERRGYLDATPWFASCPGRERLGSVAFFSMEFGLSDALPLHAGGLGILSGDMLKTASDLGVPVIGVGLLYQEGYFRQVLDADGRQEEAWPYNEPANMPIRPARDDAGNWLRIPLQLPGRTLNLRVWEATLGRTRLYLLDSNEPTNTPSDRGITAQLYGGKATIRLLQEITLGVGGWRVLEALGIAPDVLHLNEGHTAFAALERLVSAMRCHELDFRGALWATRAGNVFTSHTPVAAGFDRFDPQLVVRHVLGREGLYADLGIGPQDLLALGREKAGDADEPFNMAWLAVRLSARTNAVSRLHGETGRRLFSGLFPGWPECEVPVDHVTNGVHMPSWDAAEADALWTGVCGKERWRGGPGGACEDICRASDEDIWSMRASQRKALVERARRELQHHPRFRRTAPGTSDDFERMLDPNALTLGFGRRFTAYKRPDLLLADADRLARLLTDSGAPVQIVVAGKAHPDDEAGKRAVERWTAFVAREDVCRRAVFLEDFDIGLAQIMVQGIDVWINSPRRTHEACGTSGMKVLVNGGLNLSTRDGWWDEAFAPDVGWSFGGEEADDRADATDLYRVLEQDIVPEFYDRDADGLPRRWIERMRVSMSRLGADFCSNRMLRDYVRDRYLPAAGALADRLADGAALARALARREADLRMRWNELHTGRLDARPRDGGWTFSVHVQFGEVDAAAVRVELVAEAAGEEPHFCEAMEQGRATPGVVNGHEYSLDVTTARPSGHFTPRIVPCHAAARLPAELPLVCWPG